MALTPAEIQIVITSYIIDNNTNQVTPAKLRFVLNTINSAIQQTDASAVSAIVPLHFSPFTNKFSISEVTATQNGYLNFADYNEFKQNLLPIQADRIEVKHKGWYGGVKNTGTSIELGDICQGFGSTPADWVDSMMYVNLGSDQDITNYELIYSATVPVLP
jgi:hypothetical protein